MRIVFEPDDLRILPVNSNPNILGGRLVFSGTRVPVDALFSNLADGAALDDFLDWFPTVSREQAEAVLRFAYQTMAHAE
ncbi:MAG: DUF433 domain-containing protein [Akkermansiaceae bacterium]|nr:DUF433 domain-containing protein [Verrucomicrobiales bacterium]